MMADKWSTPKSALPAHLRPSSRVTPTLALSEGPLSPSPIARFRSTYDEEKAPIFRMKLDSENGKENFEEPSFDIIKLQSKVEELTRGHNHLTQLLHNRLSDDVNSRSKSSVSQPGISHGAHNSNNMMTLHSECHEKIEKLVNENFALQEVVNDSQRRFQDLDNEKQQLKVKIQNETTVWNASLASLQQNLDEAEARVRELKRDNDKHIRTKSTLETYLQQCPSIDEFERIKSELREKSDSCRRLHLRIDTLNQKLAQNVESHEQTRKEGQKTNLELEKYRLRVEQLESDNIAHEKRLSKSNTPGSVEEIEVLLHERDRLAKENDNLKNFVLVTHKKTSLSFAQKSKDCQKLSEKITQNETIMAELKESLVCEKDTSKHIREQLTDSIGRLSIAKNRIEILEEEIYSSNNKNEVSQDLQMLQTKTNAELITCVDEMKQLMYVSKQLVNGEDPNISMLIGVQTSAFHTRTNSYSSKSFGLSDKKNQPGVNNLKDEQECNLVNAKKHNTDEEPLCNFQKRLNFWRKSIRRNTSNKEEKKEATLEKKTFTTNDRIKELRIILASVENIRKEVSDLREHLSEKYAESVADNVSNCTTQ